MKISSENACRLKIKLYLCIAFENKRITKVFGEMAEWSIAAVLKTVVLRGTGGSNPSLSAEPKQQGFKNLSGIKLKHRISDDYGAFFLPSHFEMKTFLHRLAIILRSSFATLGAT